MTRDELRVLSGPVLRSRLSSSFQGRSRMRDAEVGSAASMAGFEIYGRGLLLGACTGSAAGAVGGFALAMASPDAVGGLALGGMTRRVSSLYGGRRRLHPE